MKEVCLVACLSVTMTTLCLCLILSPLIHSGPLKTLVRPMIVGLLQHLEQTPDKTKESINFFYFHSPLWNLLVCLKVSGLEFREGESGE